MDKIDEFGNKLNIGDVVLFNNQDHKANFIDHQFGVIVGFTNEFVIIKPDNVQKIWGFWWNKTNNFVVYRTPHRIVLINDHKYINLKKDVL